MRQDFAICLVSAVADVPFRHKLCGSSETLRLRHFFLIYWFGKASV